MRKSIVVLIVAVLAVAAGAVVLSLSAPVLDEEVEYRLTSLYYRGQDHPVDVTIGKDAAYYHEQAAHLSWDEDIQPFGYAGVISLLQRLEQALLERKHP